MAKAAAKKDDNVVELKRNGPSEDAVIAVNLGKMKRAKAEFETANGNYRNTLKHVESKGVHLAAAKDAIAIQKSGKVEEKLEYLKALFQYLKILGQPFTKDQLDLFAVEAPRTPSIEKAKEHGRYVGIMGQGMDQNPYAIDSDQGQAWIAAFHDGTKEREMILSMEPAGDELLKGDEDDDQVVDDELDPEDEE
jgi:ribosome modulation factor